jgi:hypothetical protein
VPIALVVRGQILVGGCTEGNALFVVKEGGGERKPSFFGHRNVVNFQ